MGWLRTKIKNINQQYGDQPLTGYLGAMSGYGASVGTAALIARVTGRQVPRLRASDVALMAGSTFQLSRLIAKDAVTSPIRAPFTEFEGPAGGGEVNERVTAKGEAHVIGELVSCPFCLSVWVASALGVGFVFAPRVTRLVAGAFTSVAGANFLQLAYDAAKKSSGNVPS